MALKKELMIPGNTLRVLPVIKTGVVLYKGQDQVRPYITLTEGPGSWLDGHCAVYSGETLTVVGPPKRRGDAGTAAAVKTSEGFIGYAFWCQLKASCEHI